MQKKEEREMRRVNLRRVSGGKATNDTALWEWGWVSYPLPADVNVILWKELPFLKSVGI